MSRFDSRRRKLSLIALMLGFPVVLYFVLAERSSWRPRVLHLYPATEEDSVSIIGWSSNILALRILDRIQLEEGVSTSEYLVQVWDTHTNSILRKIHFGEDYYEEAALSPDGSVLAVRATDTGSRFWNTRSGQILHSYQRKGVFHWKGPVRFTSPNHLTVGAPPRGARPDTLPIWTFEVATGKIINSAMVKTPPGLDLKDASIGYSSAGPGPDPFWIFAPDGRYGALALFKNGRTKEGGPLKAKNAGVLLFDLQNGKPQHLLPASAPDTETLAMTFSQDGRSLFVSESPYTKKGTHLVKAWNTSSGQLQTSLRYQKAIASIALEPDATTVATVEQGETRILLRDTGDGRVLRELMTHQKSLDEIKFSSDGRELASVSSDEGTIKIWRIK